MDGRIETERTFALTGITQEEMNYLIKRVGGDTGRLSYDLYNTLYDLNGGDETVFPTEES